MSTNMDSNVLCPSCKNLLQPRLLACDACDVRVEGPFQFNEFATLSPDDLHFLRIFVRCEGKVRDMEPALGLSYPTIRTRLTELKNKLARQANENTKAKPTESTAQVLELLQHGKISFEEAMTRIKNLER